MLFRSYENCYSSFLLISICMEYLFPSPLHRFSWLSPSETSSSNFSGPCSSGGAEFTCPSARLPRRSAPCVRVAHVCTQMRVRTLCHGPFCPLSVPGQGGRGSELVPDPPWGPAPGPGLLTREGSSHMGSSSPSGQTAALPRAAPGNRPSTLRGRSRSGSDTAPWVSPCPLCCRWTTGPASGLGCNPAPGRA